MKPIRLLASSLYQYARRHVLGERSFRRWTFQRTYKMARWGAEAGSSFYSGAGSRGDAAAIHVEKPVPILRDLEIKASR